VNQTAKTNRIIIKKNDENKHKKGNALDNYLTFLSVYKHLCSRQNHYVPFFCENKSLDMTISLPNGTNWYHMKSVHLKRNFCNRANLIHR